MQNLTRYARLELIGAPTPLEFLPRLSDYLGREIFIKRDDAMPVAMGGNKLRKLEFLAAQALREGADTLVTAGAIQSNHVRQTAAVAARSACTAWRCWKTRSPRAKRITSLTATGCCWISLMCRLRCVTRWTRQTSSLTSWRCALKRRAFGLMSFRLAARTCWARSAMSKARLRSYSSAKALCARHP